MTSDGNVWCWGSNSYGLLGNGTAATATAVPVELSGFTGNVTAVSVGIVSACAIVTGGSVMCWGTGANGELGNNSTMTSLAPVQVTGLTSGATAVSVAEYRMPARSSAAACSAGARTASVRAWFRPPLRDFRWRDRRVGADQPEWERSFGLRGRERGRPVLGRQ